MKHPRIGRSTAPHSFHLKDREDVIFVHIKKTGGTSLRHTLPFEDLDNHRTLKHYTVRHIIRSVGRPAWDKSFKFSFVRNPWTRLASLFRYLKRENNHTTVDLDFQAFVRQVMERNLVGWPADLPLGLPQVDWLRDDLGQIKLSFIGHQESLYQDIQALSEQLLIGPIDLPHLNQTKTLNIEDTLDLYSPEMKSMMVALYEEDFDTFGYPFGIVDHHPIAREVIRRQLAGNKGAKARGQNACSVRAPGTPWPFQGQMPPHVPMHQHFQTSTAEIWQQLQKNVWVCHPVTRVGLLRERILNWAKTTDLSVALEILHEARWLVRPIPPFLRPQSEWAFGVNGEFAEAPHLKVQRIEDVSDALSSAPIEGLSAEARRWIETIYMCDFERFGYEFSSNRRTNA